MVSIKDVAKHSGFSVATVSRVVNNIDCVGESTQKVVENSIKKLGYQQNIYAKYLRTNKIGIISLIVPTLQNSFYSELADVTEKYLRSKGYYLVLQCIEQRDLDDLSNVFSKNMFDGLIICDREQLLIEKLDEKTTVPIIALDADISGKKDLTSVSIKIDGFSGGFEAGKLLIEGGSHNLLLFGVQGFEHSMNDRVKGFVKAIVDSKDAVQSYDIIFLENLSFKESFLKTKEIFNKKKYDGVFCLSNMPTVGTVKAILDMGYKIPDDIAVVGYDNIPLLEYYSPSITCINQNIENMGQEISKSLIAMIDGKFMPNKKILPVSLIERESTRRI